MMILSGPEIPKFIWEALVVSENAGEVGRVLVLDAADIGGPPPMLWVMLTVRRERGRGMFWGYMQEGDAVGSV